ncbi:transaldolase [Kribbella sp. NBC_01245]|uniref:transaldolase n=1 Tax=Kribbella sp. NBC_01245 TaxID=2903578 RepID=UPI002E2D17D5|nr:transaldolase [Kribbella sp. NBC_01245]
MNDRLKALADAGVSIWLDDLSRDRITSGGLAGLIHDQHISGVTTNPTIFAKALSTATKDGSPYAEQVVALAKAATSTEDAVREITTDDVRAGADLFKPVYDDTDGVDGRVSIEVDPRLARETDKTIAEAKALWGTVGRENVFIKIPATKEGLPAITAVLAEGISVNVTLIFSLERYRAVADAFLSGVEKAVDNGHDVTKLGSVASFFVSRVDTEIDKRLDAIGSEEAKALKGKAAIANARLAFEAYEEIFSSDRWRELETAGAKPQRPLWASTGVKDPAYPDTMYVDQLVTQGVVNTMPQATIDAFADHGEVTGDTVRGDYDVSRKVIADLEGLGVSYDDVVQVLEDEGVSKFEVSWTELLDTVTGALKDAKW